MKKIFVLSMVALVTTVLLVSCQQERVSESVLDDAKAYFVSNCSGLVLPTIRTEGTKSYSDVNIFPNWNDVRTKNEDGIIKIEVPLVSNPYVIASIVEVHNGSIMNRYATVRSYLEYEYEGNCLSKAYVASVIEKGVNKQASYIDCKKSSNRFEIISDIDGCVMSNRIQYYGHNGVSSPRVVDIRREGFGCDFYGYKLASARITKDGYEGGEEEYGITICQMCGRKYAGHLTQDSCPYCGYNAFEGDIYCPICCKPIYECNCADTLRCPVCHFFLEYCICDKEGEGGGDNFDCPGCTRAEGECDCSCGMTLHTCTCATEK